MSVNFPISNDSGFDLFGLGGEQDVGCNEDNEEFQNYSDLEFDPAAEVPEGGWLAMSSQRNKGWDVSNQSLRKWSEWSVSLQNISQTPLEEFKKKRIRFYTFYLPQLGSTSIFDQEKELCNPAQFDNEAEVVHLMGRLGFSALENRLINKLKICLETGNRECPLGNFVTRAKKGACHQTRMLTMFSEMMKLLTKFDNIPLSLLQELGDLKRMIEASAKQPYWKVFLTESRLATVESDWRAASEYFEKRKTIEIFKEVL